MNRTVYPALQAFEEKCGIGNLFSEGHFSAEKLSKARALSRVALWTAVRDVHKCAEAMTPGQIATVCDAAPMIIGEKDMATLEKMDKLFDLHTFVSSKAKGWEHGIVVCAQIWSLEHCAHGKVRKDLFYNSKLTDDDLAYAALSAHYLARGDFQARDPMSLHSSFIGENGLVKQLAVFGHFDGFFTGTD